MTGKYPVEATHFENRHILDYPNTYFIKCFKQKLLQPSHNTRKLSFPYLQYLPRNIMNPTFSMLISTTRANTSRARVSEWFRLQNDQKANSSPWYFNSVKFGFEGSEPKIWKSPHVSYGCRRHSPLHTYKNDAKLLIYFYSHVICFRICDKTFFVQPYIVYVLYLLYTVDDTLYEHNSSQPQLDPTSWSTLTSSFVSLKCVF